MTTFDVDVYEPKAGDTYESISREFYNDTRYAVALRTYNRNKPVHGGMVDVPPIHALKRLLQGQPATGSPVTQSGISTISAPNWNTSSPTKPATGSGGKTYRVPNGGMSLPAVARLVLGNDQRWNEIYDLNPQVTPNSVTAGTELRLPSDAKIPE